MAETKSTWESVGGNNGDRIGGNANKFSYTDKDGKTHTLQVDCGTMFSDKELTGYDNFMPDLFESDGFLLTHCHMDHIGGISHMLNLRRDELKANREAGKDFVIHCAPYTQKLLEDNLALQKMPREEWPKFVKVEDGKPFEVAGFKVEPFAVSHSAPDAMGYVIESPDGVRMMTMGDFKTAPVPLGKGWDNERIAEVAKKGVDLMFLDSTSATQEGVCPPEKDVEKGIKDIVAQSEGGMIVSAVIASSAHRLHTVAMALAEHANETGKKPRTIILDGGSLKRSYIALKRCGYDIEKQVKEATGQDIKIYDARAPEAQKVPKTERFYVCTGTQGEELASFYRASQGMNRNIPMKGTNCPIYVYNLQSCIPGNEETYAAMEQGFKDLGCTTYFPDRYKENKYLTHVSGHAKAGDIRLACDLVAKNSPRPTMVVPVHGDPVQRRAVMKIAQDAGLKAAIVPNFAAVEVAKDGKVSYVQPTSKQEVWIGINDKNDNFIEPDFQYDRVTRDVETDKLRVVETIPYTKAPVEDERRGKGKNKDGKWNNPPKKHNGKNKNKGGRFNPAFVKKGGRGGR